MVEQEDVTSPEGEPPSEIVQQPMDSCSEENWEQAILSISIHALMGHLVLSTLKLIGSING